MAFLPLLGHFLQFEVKSHIFTDLQYVNPTLQARKEPRTRASSYAKVLSHHKLQPDLETLTRPNAESIVSRGGGCALFASLSANKDHEPPQFTHRVADFLCSLAHRGFADEEPQRGALGIPHAFRILGRVDPPYRGGHRLG